MSLELDLAQADLVRAMNQKILEIERAVLELKEMGRGLPMVEKNTGAIQSFIRNLKFGVSDLADVLNQPES